LYGNRASLAEILVPHEEADAVLLYEAYASPDAFEGHWNGPSNQQAKRDIKGLKISASGVRCDIVG
jgi:quinol monooxygenase YgiN